LAAENLKNPAEPGDGKQPTHLIGNVHEPQYEAGTACPLLQKHQGAQSGGVHGGYFLQIENDAAGGGRGGRLTQSGGAFAQNYGSRTIDDGDISNLYGAES